MAIGVTNMVMQYNKRTHLTKSGLVKLQTQEIVVNLQKITRSSGVSPTHPRPNSDRVQAGRLVHAGVSSFGFGGTNCRVQLWCSCRHILADAVQVQA